MNCAACGQRAPKFKCGGGCASTMYCGTECQQRDFKAHVAKCGAPVEEDYTIENLTALIRGEEEALDDLNRRKKRIEKQLKMYREKLAQLKE